jgi:hypothetical protein
MLMYRHDDIECHWLLIHQYWAFSNPDFHNNLKKENYDRRIISRGYWDVHSIAVEHSTKKYHKKPGSRSICVIFSYVNCCPLNPKVKVGILFD